jgi:hypothetical protein
MYGCLILMMDSVVSADAEGFERLMPKAYSRESLVVEYKYF